MSATLGSKLSQILPRVTSVDREDLVFIEKDGRSRAALASAFDPMDEALPLITALTGDEIVPALQDGGKRRTTLMDEVRLFAAKRAGLSFDTRAQAIALVAALSLPLGTVIATGGYAAAGDNGHALYKRVASEPSHDGKFNAGGWWELDRNNLTPEQFGATGNGTANDTLAIQACFAASVDGSTITCRDGAVYLIDNATLPDRGPRGVTIWCPGSATFKASASGDSTYMLGTRSFVGSLSFVNQRVQLIGLFFDGASNKDYTVALGTWVSYAERCTFSGGLVAGCYLTELAIDGSTATPSVVDNRFVQCIFRDNGGDGFQNTSNVQDYQIIGGTSFNNGGWGYQCFGSAGLIMIGTQVYNCSAGAARFLNYGFQSEVFGCNFEGDVDIANMSPSISTAQFGSNTIRHHNLICGMSGANPSVDLVLDSIRLEGGAKLIHNFNAFHRRVIVNGGVSETENPFGWTAGSAASGIIIANNHFNKAAGGFLNGRIYPVSTAATEGEAPNKLYVMKTLESGTTTTVVVTVTLPATTIAGSNLEIKLAASTMQNSFVDVETYSATVVAAVTRRPTDVRNGFHASVVNEVSSAGSGISAAAAWSVPGSVGTQTAVLTITLTHAAPSNASLTWLYADVTAANRSASMITAA